MKKLENIEAEISLLQEEIARRQRRLAELQHQKDEHISTGKTPNATQKKKSDGQPSESLQKVIDAIPEPIMIINRDYTVAMANRAVWDSTSSSQRDECPTCHQLTHHLEKPCSGKEHPCPLQEVLRTHSPTRVEHVHYDKEGQAIHVEIIAAPVFDDHGNIVQIIESCRDISDRKRYEDEISNQLQFLKTLIETIPSPIFYKNAEGEYSGCNTAFEKVLGLSKEEIVGKTVYDIAPRELADKYESADNELMERRGVQNYEAQVRFFDGSLHDVVFSKATYMKGDGSLGGLVGVMADITKAKHTAKALEESVSRFNTFMDNLPALAFIKDVDGKYIYLNRAVESFYNQTVEQRVGKTDHELWPKTIATEIIENDRRVLTEGKVFRVEEAVEIDGKAQHHLVVKFPIADDHQLSLVAGVAIDITDLKVAEREKDQLQRQLQTSHRMEALGTLAGGIAHDFNNILTAILGYADLAAIKAKDYPDIQNYLNRVLAASKRAKELVKQILAFSHQSEEQPRPVMLKPIVKEALKLMRASLPTTIRLEQNLNSEDATIAEPTRLHQIVMNLCANANYAMRNSGGCLRVDLSTIEIEPVQTRLNPDLKSGHYLKLAIGDTGTGISPENLDHIFEPFYTTKPKDEGSGMGLSVVHGIVKSYNGAIRVESEEGKGSVFNVYLPRIEAEESEEVEDTSTLPIGKERILFVDDELLQTELAEEALGQLGYTVTTFTDPIQALEHFRAQPESFDMVVTDMTMPDMTGNVLGKQIKSIRPDIPIIVCTGYSEIMDEKSARQSGFAGFLLKPLIVEDIARLIRSICETSVHEK